MLRYLALAAVLAALTIPATTAQTTQPAPRRVKPVQLDPAATADTVEGISVAPGMSGAPDQRVTTDYENRPLRKATPGKTKASTLSTDEPRKTASESRP